MSADIETYQKIIKKFRVAALTSLLEFFDQSVCGRKNDLIKRSFQLLDRFDNTSVKLKIDELYQDTLQKTSKTKQRVHDRNKSQNKGEKLSELPEVLRNMPTTRSMGNVPRGQQNTSRQHFDYMPRTSAPQMAFNYNDYSSPYSQSNIPNQAGSNVSSNLTVVNYTRDVDRSHISKRPVFKALPFYDILGVFIQPEMLISRTNVKNQEYSATFNLSADHFNQIMEGRVQKLSSGRCEFIRQVQLRFCKIIENVEEQEDCFPPGILVKINNKVAPLPNIIPTNKPGVEPKRPPRPVDITALLKMQINSINSVTINWTCDYPVCYGFTICLVLKLTSLDLHARLKQKGITPKENTTKLITEKLKADLEDEIATECLRVSLLCPLGKIRITSPCRASTCQHLQCFDALLFLQMNEKKPTWICPICDKKLLFSNLFIDGYFTNVLSSTNLSSDVTDIEVTETTWRPVLKSSTSSESKQKNDLKPKLDASIDIIEINDKRSEKTVTSNSQMPPLISQYSAHNIATYSQFQPHVAPFMQPQFRQVIQNQTLPNNTVACTQPPLIPDTGIGANINAHSSGINTLNNNRNEYSNKRKNDSVIYLVSDSDDEDDNCKKDIQPVQRTKKKALASLVSSKISDPFRNLNNLYLPTNDISSNQSRQTPPLITVDSSPSPSNSPRDITTTTAFDTMNTLVDFQMGYDDD